ncbi:MAG TPA: hypothetical protein VE959_34555 [Bryobacteraceae bacterium]|nr:hypothetical protein [Bryobacteraceae bacterium]
MIELRKTILSTVLAALMASSFPPPAKAQYVQQGGKLVGTGLLGTPGDWAVAISGDGNTAIAGGLGDNNNVGAAWVYTRSSAAQGSNWSQYGGKLTGGGAGGQAFFGGAVGMSADGSTAIVGATSDNSNVGAAWIFARANGGFNQQGGKLVGSDATGLPQYQGSGVALSGDGNTAIVGGSGDNYPIGAAWIYTRSNGVWTQQGPKLVGTGYGSSSFQGWSVALSGDGNTALVGALGDNGYTGAAWVFTRSNGVWTQQGSKLIGAGAIGAAALGYSVALSADGNTAIVGGRQDAANVGAAWIFTRSNGVWTQQSKLVGTGAVGQSYQGSSVSISADGNTAVLGGWGDNDSAGAVWVFARTNGVWNQLGDKLIGTGATPGAEQGYAVAISGDAATVFEGGFSDNNNVGAAWAFASQGAAAPAATSASPAGGSGTTQTFTFTFSDTGGWQSLTVVDALVNNVLDGRQACYVAFVPSGANSGSVYLVDNAGDAGGPYSGMVLPGSGSVSNGQCSITGAGSLVAGSGNTLTLTLPITFTPAFAGNKVVYLSAQDASSNTGWQALGTWTVPGTGIAGPAVSGVSPVRGTGFTQTLTFTFTDTNGWQDISVANVLIASAINGIGACYVAFAPSGAGSGSVYLVDNAGDAGGPYSGMVLPGSGSVSNGQCVIAGTGSSASGSVNTLTLTLAITFSQSFAGNRIVYAAARNGGGQNSGWQAVGTAGIQ